MAERASDRWISIALSVLLHAGVVGLLVYGWWTFQHRPRPPAPTLAIEATVVDARALNGARPEPAPAPKPAPEPAPEPAPPPESEGPPAPTPEELAQRAQAVQQAEQKRQDEARQVAEQREAAEKAAAQDAKQRAEEQRVTDQKRAAEEKRKTEEEKRKTEEARLRAQREADLRHSLEAEEHVMAARSSGALSSWTAQIQARIQRAWLKPPSARSGIDCMVYVTQVPGGEVTHVRVGDCNGDQSVRESIEAAVLRASPLPPPPDPALFDRNLEIEFKPVDSP